MGPGGSPGNGQGQRAQRPQPAARRGCCGARQQQHQRHAVQDAKVDEALRKHGIRGRAHQQGTASNLTPAPPEPAPALPLLHGNGLTEPGTKNKQADDGSTLHGPKRVGVKIGVQVAKVLQVIGEVKQRHPDHGQAAQHVDASETGSGMCGHGVFSLSSGKRRLLPRTSVAPGVTTP